MWHEHRQEQAYLVPLVLHSCVILGQSILLSFYKNWMTIFVSTYLRLLEAELSADRLKFRSILRSRLTGFEDANS